jgi:hypothetical protein
MRLTTPSGKKIILFRNLIPGEMVVEEAKAHPGP